MEIKVADSAGFCFGVKQAVDSVYKLIDDNEANKRIYTLGPIIHNDMVVDDLKDKGVYPIESIDEADTDSIVIIRSHGVAKSVIDELDRKNISYIDSTCPFVKKIHDTVHTHSLNGDEIVIVGSPSHPEVKGILGWSVNGGTVIDTIEEAKEYKPSDVSKNVCVVAQTTFNSKKFQDFVEIFEKKEYYINIVNTICRATMTRQEEADALSKVSDAMIVVGGAHSSNSKKLYDICKHQCERTVFIQTADQLDDISFDGCARLSVTAGASTPNTLIQEVLEACQKK